MFIKKISIENAFGILNQITLDLKQNKGNVKTDILSGYFVEKNNEIFSPLVAIAGRNASGKTSILRSLRHILSFFSEQPAFFNSFRFIRHLRNIDESDAFFRVGKINTSSMYKLFLNERFEKFFKIKNFFDEEILKQELLSRGTQNDKNAELEKLLDDKTINNILNDIFDEKLKKFEKIKNVVDIPTKIEIFFYDDQYGDFSLVYSDFILDNNIYNFDYKILTKNTKNIQNILKKIIEYSNSFFYSGIINSLTNDEDFNSRRSKEIETFKNLSLTFNKKDIIKIINVCDESIVDISFYDELNKEETNGGKQLSGLYNDKGQELGYEHLSDGTKKFLYLFSNISYRIANNESVLIIIDEIDNYLHNEIVNFIKNFVLVVSKTKDIQLFFTSHNPQTLTSFMSTKQTYLLMTKPDKHIIKFSKEINKNHSPIRQLLEKKIGDHPSNVFVDNVTLELYNEYFKNR